MSRIAATFDRLRAERRAALVPFVTAGDPSPDLIAEMLRSLAANGADVIELGVPFSDPMADGPVIQRSSERALLRGAGIRYVLDCVRAFRQRDDATPVVLMGYLNPVEIRGSANFAAAAAEAGVDGVLLVDLPPEEADEYRAAFASQQLALISLASPTTPEARLQRLATQADGYLYYVSFAGVTGADRLDIGDAGQRLQHLRAMASIPVFAGFGIRDAQSAAAMAANADGVVVGSALVSALDGCTGEDEAARRAGEFLRPLRAALDGLAVAA